MTGDNDPFADQTLLRELADGGFHSGAGLATRLGVSRTAVWKKIHALAGLGLDIRATPGRGYRIEGGLDLLDPAAVYAAAGDAVRNVIDDAEFLSSVDSTNKRLLERSPPPPGRCHLCLADFQTAGRGRRGRTWVTPYAGGVCLSLGWTFPAQPPEFSAMSLVTGLACCFALEEAGLDGVGLKWPNDLVCQSGKLGGILIEIRGEADGPVHVVIGIGLNVRLPTTIRKDLEKIAAWPPVDLEQCMALRPSRSKLAGLLAKHLVASLESFTANGFMPFAEDFAARDMVAGQAVTLHCGDEVIDGTAAGIDNDGALLLDTAEGRQRFYGGEVSLRLRQ